MGWGDEILAAGEAQRIYDMDPRMKIGIVGLDHQPRWHEIWEGNPILAKPEEYRTSAPIRVIVNGPNARPYIIYPFTKDTGWTFNKAFRARDHVAKIYLTEQEFSRGATAKQKYGPYVLIEPWTKHENWRWPIAEWKAFLKAAGGDYTFLQHTHEHSITLPGVRTEKATFREACGLLTGAVAYVRSESGLCHAAAAFGIPQVTIWGGCMDPEVLGGYPLQVNVVDRGAGSPCGRWHPCLHCAAAMKTITPARVVRALNKALTLTGEETDLYA